MRPVLLFMLWLMMGCPKQAPDPSYEPSLPAPRGQVYVSVPAQPTDPVVARVVKERAWNETLSGAASGLAMAWATERGGLTAWEAREAAWQAGWPWPLAEVRGWTTAQGAEPPDDFVAWIEALDPETPLGAVRARGDKGDVWVVLRSHPRMPLAPKPRQVGIGGRLDFAALPDATITVADPTGRVQSATLDRSRAFHPDRTGEWLFEIRDATGVAALFPVYAGMVPPEITVLEEHPPPIDAEAAAKSFRTAFDAARDAYGMPNLGEDALLASAARATIRQRSAAPDFASQLGYDADKIWRIECIARTIEGCVDQVLWNPRARPALLATSADAGVAAELVSRGIHVVAIVGAR